MLARAFLPRLLPVLGDRQVTLLLPPSKSKTPIVAIGKFEMYMPTTEEVTRGMFPKKKLEERLKANSYQVAINLDVTGHPFPACGALHSGAKLRIGCAGVWGSPFANIILTPEPGQSAPGTAQQLLLPQLPHCFMPKRLQIYSINNTLGEKHHASR